MLEKLRPELTTVPERMRSLPVERGYPVPWFVAVVNGVFEFRAADARKRSEAVRERLCWVCGQKLGRYLSFVLGPMCAITRSTVEPPCHKECAIWSAINCPFLARPHMVRREGDMPEGVTCSGEMIDRNPGVCLIWTTLTYRTFKDNDTGWLIEVGDPLDILAFAEGRPVQLAEVQRSINSGLPLLREKCDQETTPARQKKAHYELGESITKTTELLEQHLITESTE
jgi:hypothetical protein